MSRRLTPQAALCHDERGDRNSRIRTARNAERAGHLRQIPGPVPLGRETPYHRDAKRTPTTSRLVRTAPELVQEQAQVHAERVLVPPSTLRA